MNEYTGPNDGSISIPNSASRRNSDDFRGDGSGAESPKAVRLKKHPSAPKRFRTAFIMFSKQKHAELRAKLQAEGEEIDTIKVARMVSDAWREMSPEEKEEWHVLSRQDKERYLRQKEEYSGPWKVAADAKPPRDPTEPKKPTPAYFLFSNERRHAIKQENPSATNAEISGTLSRMWKEADEPTRKKYMDLEQEQRSNYKQAMEQWKREKRLRHESWNDGLEQQEGSASSPSEPKRIKLEQPSSSLSRQLKQEIRSPERKLRPGFENRKVDQEYSPSSSIQRKDDGHGAGQSPVGAPNAPTVDLRTLAAHHTGLALLGHSPVPGGDAERGHLLQMLMNSQGGAATTGDRASLLAGIGGQPMNTQLLADLAAGGILHGGGYSTAGLPIPLAARTPSATNLSALQALLHQPTLAPSPALSSWYSPAALQQPVPPLYNASLQEALHPVLAAHHESPHLLQQQHQQQAIDPQISALRQRLLALGGGTVSPSLLAVPPQGISATVLQALMEQANREGSQHSNRGSGN
eukprot:Nitzschia sp. Nitz4//scaffold99_size76975//52642//54375//NITZ4_005580-RA/size76975-processed-gene-0.50-mRNA-1//-1//CDS//3329560862//1321//frame0